jgi:general secretion pathway protein G
MKKIFKARRSGFTLVELLIVTVIIGILAGMMMLMMGSATDGAVVSKTINDLRLIKSATLLYYSDEYKWPDGSPATASDSAMGADTVVSLEQYMDKPISANYNGNIYVTKGTDGKFYYGVSPSAAFSETVKEKMAKNGSLVDNTGKSYDQNSTGPVYMIVR